MLNNTDPDQTAVKSSLICVCTVWLTISAEIFRINKVSSDLVILTHVSGSCNYDVLLFDIKQH